MRDAFGEWLKDVRRMIRNGKAHGEKHFCELMSETATFRELGAHVAGA